MFTEDAFKEEYAKIQFFFNQTFGLRLAEEVNITSKRKLQLLFKNDTKFNPYEYLVKYNTNNSNQKVFSIISIFTNNHTKFLREKLQFDFLRKEIIPSILDSKSFKGGENLHIWSAASSSGEEPYSISMTLNEAMGQSLLSDRVKILATDIDVEALKIGKKGIYQKDKVQMQIPPSHLKYFKDFDVKLLQIDEKIKNSVLFKWLNLNADVYPMTNKFHIIFCRNLLIYFSENSRLKLIKNLINCLHPGGYLFLGLTENIGFENQSLLSLGSSIYQKKW